MNDHTEDLEFRKQMLCATCGKEFGSLHCRNPFDLTKVFFFQRNCEPCVAAEQVKMARRTIDDASERERERRAERWAEICPEEYRLTIDGGKTVPDRLHSDQPKAKEIVEKHILCGHGVLIRGDSGGGKTRTMYALLRKFHFAAPLTQRTIRIEARTSAKFEREARTAGGNHTLDKWFDGLATCDALFIDDIGKTPWSDNTVSHFFDLVEERTTNRRPIFITTNLDGEALVKRLDLGEDMAVPLLRRMREHMTGYVFKTRA